MESGRKMTSASTSRVPKSVAVFEAYCGEWLRGLNIGCIARRKDDGDCEVCLTKNGNTAVIPISDKRLESAQHGWPNGMGLFYEELVAKMKDAVEYLEPNKFAHLRGGR